MTRTFKVLVALVVVLFLVFAIAGGTHASDEPQVVQVTLSDYQVQLSQFTVTPGKPVQFVVTNSGSLPHQVVVEPYLTSSTTMAQDVPVIAPGTARSIVQTLNAGVYKIECLEWDHATRGMLNVFAADLPRTQPVPLHLDVLIPIAALVLGAAYIIGDSAGLKLIASK